MANIPTSSLIGFAGVSSPLLSGETSTFVFGFTGATFGRVSKKSSSILDSQSICPSTFSLRLPLSDSQWPFFQID
jgi:hypothetical protein